MTDEAFEKYQSVWTAVHNLVDKMLSGEAGAEDIRDKLTDEFRFWKRSGHDISATTPQPEQEPVFDCPRCGHCCPQRKPLTDEQIAEALGFGEHTTATTRAILTHAARAIEAKIKENT